MPRRLRTGKRREANPLDVAVALVNANVSGCAAIPDDVTLDELRRMHERGMPQRTTCSWGYLAFEVQHPQPCTVLEVYDVFEGRTKLAGITCGTACRFTAALGTAVA
jgi:hypothetical protein